MKQSSNTGKNKKYLVIGGTGMLAGMCAQLPVEELIIASRFESNHSNLKNFDANIMKVSLDYTDKSSKVDFLERLAGWTALEYCVLWVHSHAHDFSFDVIKSIAQAPAKKPTKVIHVFGTGVDDKKLSQCAHHYGVDYIAVKLGSVKTLNGKRWMTNKEISERVSKELQ